MEQAIINNMIEMLEEGEVSIDSANKLHKALDEFNEDKHLERDGNRLAAIENMIKHKVAHGKERLLADVYEVCQTHGYTNNQAIRAFATDVTLPKHSGQGVPSTTVRECLYLLISRELMRQEDDEE